MIKLIGIFSMIVASLLTLVGAILVGLFIFTGFPHKVDYFVRWWAKSLNFLARVDVEVIGIEKLPEEPCLYIFNHLSLFDIPIIFDGIPRNLRFGAKKELFYIPIFGWGMKMMGIIPIDRKNRARAVKALQKAIIKMKRDKLNIILAPEGTRQIQLRVGEFKTGPFVTALQAQVPIVPLVLTGAHDILPKNHFIFRLDKRRSCRIEVLDPIATKGLNEEDRHHLKAVAHEKMSKAFQKSQP